MWKRILAILWSLSIVPLGLVVLYLYGRLGEFGWFFGALFFWPLPFILGRRWYRAVIDSEFRRALVEVASGQISQQTILFAWPLLAILLVPAGLGLQNLEVIPQRDMGLEFLLWFVSSIVLGPLLFGGIGLYQNIRGWRMARSWEETAKQIGLMMQVDPVTSTPEMNGDYRGRRISIGIDSESASYATVIEVDLSDAWDRRELILSDSLVFRPTDGRAVYAENGDEIRVYGTVSDDAMQKLGNSDLIRDIHKLHATSDQLKLGTETIEYRARGVLWGAAKLAEILNGIVDLGESLDAVFECDT